MAIDVNAVRTRAVSALKGFSPSQLVIIGLLATVTVVTGSMFMSWATAPTYGVLIAGVDAKDASAITDKLKADGIAYKLENGGQTISVPTDKVDAERVAMAAAGLPKGTTSGYEILDKQGMTSSSFQQQVAYQRALEGELTKTLLTLQGVQNAEVHIVLPQDDIFTDQQQPARASVMLDTGTQTLSDETVQSVIHLVASAVRDLDPKNVTVTDTAGHLLSATATDGGSNRQLALEQAYQDQLEARATTMLNQMLGDGHAIVRVNAEVDTATHTIDSQTYDPKKQVILHDEESAQQYQSAGSTGPQGVLQAVPSQPTPGATSSPGSYRQSTSSKDYAYNLNVEHTELPAGDVKKLTVAVALDSNAKNAPALKDVQAIVANAVGLDPTRGDTISVSTSAFPINAPVGTPAPKKASAASPIGKYVSTGVAALVLLMAGFAFLRALRSSRVTEVPVEHALAVRDDLARRALVGADRNALGGGEGRPPSLPAGSAADLTGELDIARLVDDNPDEVAALLKSWLASTGGSR